MMCGVVEKNVMVSGKCCGCDGWMDGWMCVCLG